MPVSGLEKSYNFRKGETAGKRVGKSYNCRKGETAVKRGWKKVTTVEIEILSVSGLEKSFNSRKGERQQVEKKRLKCTQTENNDGGISMRRMSEC